MRRTVSIFLAALTATIITAAPVAAAEAGPEDTNCRYKATQVGRFGWTEARLKRLGVRPPKMYALGERSSQTVAWRFKVYRWIGNDPSTAKQTYRSPWETATATANQPASFSPMGVDVNLPTVSGDYDLTDVHYATVIKKVWYKRDGSVYASSEGADGTYHVHVDGSFQYTLSDFEGCQGEIRQFFDGP